MYVWGVFSWYSLMCFYWNIIFIYINNTPTHIIRLSHWLQLQITSIYNTPTPCVWGVFICMYGPKKFYPKFRVLQVLARMVKVESLMRPIEGDWDRRPPVRYRWISRGRQDMSIGQLLLPVALLRAMPPPEYEVDLPINSGECHAIIFMRWWGGDRGFCSHHGGGGGSSWNSQLSYWSSCNCTWCGASP